MSGENVAAYNLGFSRSGFSEENRRIDLLVGVDVCDSKGESQEPYYLKPEVRGQFRFSEDVKFSTDKIEKWAEVVGHYVLLPYLRDQAHAFTQRTGFPPLTLPIYQLPTINLSDRKASAP